MCSPSIARCASLRAAAHAGAATAERARAVDRAAIPLWAPTTPERIRVGARVDAVRAVRLGCTGRIPVAGGFQQTCSAENHRTPSRSWHKHRRPRPTCRLPGSRCSCPVEYLAPQHPGGGRRADNGVEEQARNNSEAANRKTHIVTSSAKLVQAPVNDSAQPRWYGQTAQDTRVIPEARSWRWIGDDAVGVSGIAIIRARP